jgi:NAD(P)-dependent dehydrogenase (short-subunit alcohol dehydrogenase family)
MDELDGKIALATGGVGGIGPAISRALLRSGRMYVGQIYVR